VVAGPEMRKPDPEEPLVPRSTMIGMLTPPRASELSGLVRPLIDAIRWASRRVRPDHSSLHSGPFRIGNVSGSSRYYVTVAVAPSRRLPRKRAQLKAEDAQVLTARIFPGVFLSVPNHSSGELVRFEVMEADGFTVDKGFWILPTGLLYLQW